MGVLVQRMENLNGVLVQADTESTSVTRCLWVYRKLPGGLGSKESACSAEDPGSIPGSGRSPGDGNGYPLQYSCLENSMDRGA